MRWKPAFLGVSFLLLGACEQQSEGEPVARTRIDGQTSSASSSPTPTESQAVSSSVESACRSIIFEDTPLTHCLAVPSRHRIAAELGPGDGAPYRSLEAFATDVEGANIAFAMNAGMFDEDGMPVGYFVESSNRVQSLNEAVGEGNFYMQPNGVFYGSGEQWQVRTTADFLANVTERPEFGTQSGPMLVIDGKLHPDIRHDGPSREIRNAVGIDEQGRGHFVISNAPVSFGKLARFYRDELSVKNALFLDGNVSLLWNPATDRLDTGAPIGPILVIMRKDSE